MTRTALDHLAEMSVSEIEAADFSTLVGLLNEPNMPSGGGRTVRRVIDLVRLRPGARILEIGSNTGYTSIEFASWIDGEVVGIDVNPDSVAFATAKARSSRVDNVRFEVADARRTSFEDRSFDLVFCSNVTSFIQDKQAALDEYYRLVARAGWLVAVPIYYHVTPPAELVAEVGRAIGVELPVTDQNYWRELFGNPRSTLLDAETYEYLPQPPATIAAYTDAVIENVVGPGVATRNVEAARGRLRYFYELFDRNLRYARYDILTYRCDHPNPEPVLHESRRVRRG